MSEKTIDINWDDFQNDKGAFKFLRRILKFVEKYQGMGISEMVSSYRKDKLSQDYLNLAALNVYLAVFAGKAEGEQKLAYGRRKSKIAAEIVDIKLNGLEDYDKAITDTLCNAEAEKRARKYRIREAKALELSFAYINVMHRTNRVLDAIENAIRSLEAEHKRTK